MGKIESILSSLALGSLTLLSGCAPREVTISSPTPTSEQALRHLTDLNIQVLRGNDVNLKEQNRLDLSKAYISFLTARQNGKLTYLTGDENNPLKSGGLTEVIAAVLNTDLKNIPDETIDYTSFLPTEIKFGNESSVFFQPVLINAIDPSTGNKYQKVVLFGSGDGQSWGVVNFTKDAVNVRSSQNAGVIIEGTNTVYTSYDRGNPPSFTSLLISGGTNGALFSSAVYVINDNGQWQLVFRDQGGTKGGPLTDSSGLFEVNPPTDNQSPTPSPFKFDVSSVSYKIEPPPKIETPMPTATPAELFNRSTWSVEMTNYLATLPNRKAAEKDSDLEQQYINEDQSYHTSYMKIIINYLTQNGVDIASLQNADLLDYDTSISVMEKLWQRQYENYLTTGEYQPTPLSPWLLRGDGGKTSYGMYNSNDFVILPRDANGNLQYRMMKDRGQSEDLLIWYNDVQIDPTLPNARELLFVNIQKFLLQNNEVTVSMFGIQTPLIIALNDSFGVLTGYVEIPGIAPDKAVAAIIGFKNEAGTGWVYRPFVLNFALRPTTPLYSLAGQVNDGSYKIYPVTEGHIIIPAGDSMWSIPSRVDYHGLSDILSFLNHEVYGKPAMMLFALDEQGKVIDASEGVIRDDGFREVVAAFFSDGGIETFDVLQDGGTAFLGSPLTFPSIPTATVTVTPPPPPSTPTP